MLLVGCHRHPPGQTAAPTPSASSAVTPDRLQPGELLEGPDHAFALKLPRGIRVEESFAAVVFARGQLKAADVANYIRARVTGGAISVGASATVFDRVFAPGEPARPLTIQVESLPHEEGTRVEVRDMTPPPGMPNATDEEKWKAVGMSPNGKILDPTKLR
jgi:hypothetical protein